MKVGLDDYLLIVKDAEFEELVSSAELMTSWQHNYKWGEKGPKNHVKNVVIALEKAPELQGLFSYDLMSMSIIINGRLPNSSEDNSRAVSDGDIRDIHCWLVDEGGLDKISKELVYDAVDICARRNKFHPVRDYLLSLKWDKSTRLDSWLARFAGADPTPYSSFVGRKFLISMVARVMEPGCKVDTVMVFHGGQGTYKSTAFRILAGGRKWFSGSLPHIGKDEKRVSQHLRGKWLIEIAELASMRNAQQEEIKDFISRQEEKYVPMFGRTEVEELRQCLFVGSTNDDVFLRDETGARRWWPVKIGEIDLNALSNNRDQLLAEAYVAYLSGEKWHADREFEDKYIKPEQDARFVGGEWDDIIEKFLEIQLKIASEDYAVTPATIAELALNFELRQINSDVCKKICGSLKRLGWIKRTRSNKDRTYIPPPGTHFGNKIVALPKRKKY